MSKSKNKSEIEVWVSVPSGTSQEGDLATRPTEEVETHSKAKDRIDSAVKADSEVFLSSWRATYQAVESVFASEDKVGKSGGFSLYSVTARLSLTAKGRVVFVGELGGEVSFEATFRRKD